MIRRIVAVGAVVGVCALDSGVAFADASGCTGRNGPGSVNTTCIVVAGERTRVDSIRATMESLPSDPRPTTLCGVQVEEFGTLSNDRPWRKQGTAQCSYAGYAYVDFSPPSIDFRADSQLCAATTFDGERSNPACITILA